MKMSQFKSTDYLIVKIFDIKQHKLTDNKCIPAPWVKNIVNNDQITIHYPPEEEFSVELRVKNGDSVDEKWPETCALLIAKIDSYEAAIQFIKKKNQKDLPDDENELLNNLANKKDVVITEVDSLTSKKILESKSQKTEACKPAKRKLSTENNNDPANRKKSRETLVSSSTTHSKSINKNNTTNTSSSTSLLYELMVSNVLERSREPNKKTEENSISTEQSAIQTTDTLSPDEETISSGSSTPLPVDVSVSTEGNHGLDNMSFSTTLPNSEINMIHNLNHIDWEELTKLYHQIVKVKNYINTMTEKMKSVLDQIIHVYEDGLQPLLETENYKSSTVDHQITRNNQQTDSESQLSSQQKYQPAQSEASPMVFISNSDNYKDTQWTLKFHKPGPGLKELMPHTGIYVLESQLNNCETIATDVKKFARALLPIIFTKEALNTCTFTGNKPKGLIPESYKTRPGLDPKGRDTLLSYAIEVGKKRGWTEIHPQLIISSLKNKLQVQKYRNKNK